MIHSPIKPWIRFVTFVALASVSRALQVTAFSSFVDPSSITFSDERIERGMYESYVYHGIMQVDGLDPDDNNPDASQEGIGAEEKHVRKRKLKSTSDGSECNICSLSPNVRGRFGDASFESGALVLPGKKGVALTLRTTNWEVNLPRVKFLNPSWNYSWGPKLIDEQPPHIEFVPMVWRGASAEQVQSIIDKDIRPNMEAGRIKRLLGFNEPNLPDQANMDVQTAVSLWPLLESTGLPLAGPSVSLNGVSTWMRDWNENAFAQQLRVDYVAVHWYQGPNLDSFKAFLKHMYNLNGGETPLLITEFAPADWEATVPSENRYSPSRVLSFMKEALPWLEAQDWILGYAWFPFNVTFAAGASSALFDENGDPTPLGRFYSSVTPDNPSGDQSISWDY